MKIFLFLILILNSSLGLAIAREHITYVDFVNLDKANQREVIKMVQTFYTTSENIQNYYIFESKKLKKKTTFINKVLNHFRAYADEAEGAAAERQTCFYGGWLSQYYVNKSNTERTGRRYPVCANPVRLSHNSEVENNDSIFENSHVNDNTKYNAESKAIAIKSGEYYDELQVELKSNPTSFVKVSIDEDLEAGKFQIELNQGPESKESCSVPQDIICNPMVYGRYKGGAICVPKKSDDAYNTSFLCAKALEKIKEVDGEEEYNKTLDAAVEESIKRPELFSNTLINLYDTCMCQGKSYSYTDDHYSRRVYNSRTCVAILNSTKSIIQAIGRNNKCSEFETTNLGAVSDMALFFNRAYKHVNDEIEELNNTYSLAKLDTLYNGNRSKRYREQNGIKAIRAPLDRLREQNQAGDDASNKACPISMDEDAKTVKVILAGNPDVTNMTDTINVNFKVNGERVNLSEGDVSVKVKNGESIAGLDLNSIVYNNGTATFVAPLKYLKTYQLEFTVSQNGNIAKEDHNVIQVSPVCNATISEAEGGKYNVNVSTNRSIAGKPDGAVAINDGVTYQVKVNDTEVAYSPGTPVDLGSNAGGDGALKVFAKLDGIEDPLECNGESIANSDLILSKVGGEKDERDFKYTFSMKLEKGNEQVSLVLASPSEDQAILNKEVLDLPSAQVNLSPKDGSIQVIADTYVDKAYKIKFTSEKDGKSAEKTVDIPKQDLSCIISKDQTSVENQIAISVELKSGESELSARLSENISWDIKIGEKAFGFKEKNADNGKYLFTASELSTEEAEKDIVGTVTIPAIKNEAITCSTNASPEPPTPVVASDEDTCNGIEATLDESGENLSLVAKVKIKTKEGEEKEVTESSELPDGFSFKWVKISERAPASTAEGTEEMVGQDDNPDTQEEDFSSDFTASVTKGENDLAFKALVFNGESEESCSSNVLTLDKEETTTPTTTPTTPTPTRYGSPVPGNAPQRIPQHSTGGRLFQGNR
jgi:hypothetical protein